MQLENLTSLDFSRAVAACEGVGIIPIGVLEAHASHLPLGTDTFVAHWTAVQAAEKEPAIVFPFYPFGINVETGHLPGGIVIKRELVFALLENICDELARNGVMKIVIYSGHGGNRFFIPLFVQTLPEKAKPYLVYYADLPFFGDSEDIFDSKENGHACEIETSMILHIQAELVKMEQVPSQTFHNQAKLQNIQEAGGYTPMDWYSMYPHMYVGNASKATAHKGKFILDQKVELLAKLIRAVKDDTITSELAAEFNQKLTNPKPAAIWKAKH